MTNLLLKAVGKKKLRGGGRRIYGKRARKREIKKDKEKEKFRESEKDGDRRESERKRKSRKEKKRETNKERGDGKEERNLAYRVVQDLTRGTAEIEANSSLRSVICRSKKSRERLNQN